MNKKELRAVAEIQGLVGLALGNHHNDRDPNHIESVARPLEKAFQLCLYVLGKYPPVDMAASAAPQPKMRNCGICGKPFPDKAFCIDCVLG
jgi:hypothetical protein